MEFPHRRHKGFRFHDLPFELRLNIYNAYFPASTVSSVTARKFQLFRILHLDKSTREEALRHYCRSRTVPLDFSYPHKEFYSIPYFDRSRTKEALSQYLERSVLPDVASKMELLQTAMDITQFQKLLCATSASHITHIDIKNLGVCACMDQAVAHICLPERGLEALSYAVGFAKSFPNLKTTQLSLGSFGMIQCGMCPETCSNSQKRIHDIVPAGLGRGTLHLGANIVKVGHELPAPAIMTNEEMKDFGEKIEATLQQQVHWKVTFQPASDQQNLYRIERQKCPSRYKVSASLEDGFQLSEVEDT